MTAQPIDITTLDQTDQPTTLAIHGLDDERKAFLGYLARYTGQTLRNYEFDMAKFKQWTLDVGLLTMLLAERHHLELFVAHLRDRHLAAATIARRFGVVRGYYLYAHSEGLIAKNPAAYVKTPKIQHDQQYRTYYESVDMAIVLRVATDVRYRAIITLMFDLALRVGELCALNVGSLQHTKAGPVLRFIGKGNKAANMLVPAASMAALDDYLTTRSDAAPDDPLFLNHRGHRLARANVQYMLDQLSTAAEVPYRVTPHGVRRASCRFGIQQGESIDDAAERLRHSDSRVTRLCYALETGNADILRQQVSAQMANLARSR